MPNANPRLFPDDNPVAQRQPKTDRLVLERFLNEAARYPWVIELAQAAHPILIKWADLESSGQLAQMHESQLQGEFLGDVFAGALGYTRFSEGAGQWTLEQHHTIAGQEPDAILGHFKPNKKRQPLAVVELKGPTVHLDRDRSNGRTAVLQCWDYLNHTGPECRFGVVSNMVSFRLYERGSTPRRYAHFSLQSLRDPHACARFVALFHSKGLVEQIAATQPPLAVQLLDKTSTRQREVGDKLYERYSEHRTLFIRHLHKDHDIPLDDAIEYAQRLLDRVIFIAFCEDRGLLPAGSIKNAHEQLPAFSAVTNPRWQNYKTLFKFVNEGSREHGIPPYNGGLFKVSPADNLELDDSWTDFFREVGTYDFADEINLDVLGHLFEKSITELEKLREGALFGGDADKAEQYARMPQSAKRKRLGIYYTPPELTSRIVEYTVDDLIHQRWTHLAEAHGTPTQDADRQAPDTVAYWRDAVRVLRDLKIVDPACGSGAFLFQAYNVMEHRYHEAIGHLLRLNAPDAEQLWHQVPHFILSENLYGVDLSPEAVEITQLALWIRSATPDQSLEKLSENIVHGNSLVHDPAVHPAAFDWRTRFPEVFDRTTSEPRAASEPPRAASEPPHVASEPPHVASEPPRVAAVPDRDDTSRLAPSAGGFDCVIGNPPWERIKLQEREFFSLPAPEIATATNAAKRRQLVARLESDDPALYQRYQQALAAADALLTYCRTSGGYPLTGKGDINTYAVFAELASQLVAPTGRVGLLTPSGIASDMTTKDFFASIAETDRLIRLYDFENRTKHFFPDVDGRFKFCILNFGGSAHQASRGVFRGSPRSSSPAAGADFVFFAHTVEELDDPKRKVKLSGDDIKLLNPNTRTCPIFRGRRDAEITKAIYRRVPVLIDHNRKGPTGNPWGISFNRMFDQTNDAELFREAASLKAQGFKLKGNRWVKASRGVSPRNDVYLPLYEAKMLQMFDHRAANVITDQNNWVRQGQTERTSLVEYQNPEHMAMPRFWIGTDAINPVCEDIPTHFLCFKDVTSPTNQRTMIACCLPFSGVVNSAPLVITGLSPSTECCLLGNLNSIVYDFVMRQKISNLHLNFFIVEQVPALPPDTYDKPCPWDRKTTLERWISERVLKLTCTAEDMLPLADACGFASGSFRAEYGGRLNKWDPAERAQLMAELDAAYFILYGIDRDDAQYILSTFNGIHAPSGGDPLLTGRVTVAEHILNTYDYLQAHI